MGLLADRVRRKIVELGTDAASEFFRVSKAYVAQWRDGSRAVPAVALERIFEAECLPTAGEEVQAFQTDWEGRKFAILLPWYKQTNPMTAFSVLGNFERSKMRLFMVFGDAYVAHSRNTLSRMFLDAGCEWALMVDDDMVLPFGDPTWFNQVTGFNLAPAFAGQNTVQRLLSHRKSLVGGLYFGRFPNGRPMYAEGCNQPQEAALSRLGPRNECKPTRWVATGCMLVHRTVFEDINKTFPHLGDNWFSPSEQDTLKAVDEAIELLREQKTLQAMESLDAGLKRARANSKVGMGEDVTFCIRAAAAGHQPHVDMGLVCGHIGSAVYGPFNTRSTV